MHSHPWWNHQINNLDKHWHHMNDWQDPGLVTLNSSLENVIDGIKDSGKEKCRLSHMHRHNHWCIIHPSLVSLVRFTFPSNLIESHVLYNPQFNCVFSHRFTIALYCSPCTIRELVLPYFRLFLVFYICSQPTKATSLDYFFKWGPCVDFLHMILFLILSL